MYGPRAGKTGVGRGGRSSTCRSGGGEERYTGAAARCARGGLSVRRQSHSSCTTRVVIFVREREEKGIREPGEGCEIVPQATGSAKIGDWASQVLRTVSELKQGVTVGAS